MAAREPPNADTKLSYERQNTEDTADLPLKIPVATVYEHFQCPICMSRIDKACITTCGHRFCIKCIEECINRRHECPCCKAELNADDVIVDTGFDALIRAVRSERRVAEKEYFQHIVDDATNAPFRSGQSSVESPLQIVLQKHLKLSLGQHEAYHQQLILDYQRGVGKITQEKHFLSQQVIREFPHDPDHPTRLSRLAEVEEKWEEKKSALADELEKTEKLLAAAYDRYLMEHLPPPSTIPVNVTLTVPEKNFTAMEVLLRPEESMAAILKKLRSLMEAGEMAIAEFPQCEELEISIISPFAPVDGNVSVDGSVEEMELKDKISHVHQTIHADCQPVLEFGIKPGTEIRFKGQILLESEVPKLCFAAAFVKGQKKIMDYFTCKQCGYNWVCRPCTEKCHKGHEMVPYVMNHQPTWACCYCARKKKCGLQGD